MERIVILGFLGGDVYEGGTVEYVLLKDVIERYELHRLIMNSKKTGGVPDFREDNKVVLIGLLNGKASNVIIGHGQMVGAHVGCLLDLKKDSGRRVAGEMSEAGCYGPGGPAEGEERVRVTWAGERRAGDVWAGDAWAGDASWERRAGCAWAGDAWAGDSWAGDAWAGEAWAGDAWAGQCMTLGPLPTSWPSTWAVSFQAPLRADLGSRQGPIAQSDAVLEGEEEDDPEEDPEEDSPVLLEQNNTGIMFNSPFLIIGAQQKIKKNGTITKKKIGDALDNGDRSGLSSSLHRKKGAGKPDGVPLGDEGSKNQSPSLHRKKRAVHGELDMNTVSAEVAQQPRPEK